MPTRSRHGEHHSPVTPPAGGIRRVVMVGDRVVWVVPFGESEQHGQGQEDDSGQQEDEQHENTRRSGVEQRKERPNGQR